MKIALLRWGCVWKQIVTSMLLASSLMRVTCSSSKGFRRKTFSLVKKGRDHKYSATDEKKCASHYKTVSLLHGKGLLFLWATNIHKMYTSAKIWHQWNGFWWFIVLFHDTPAQFFFMVPCCISLVVTLNSLHKSSNHLAISFFSFVIYRRTYPIPLFISVLNMINSTS